jgi:hypothetical protein
VKDIQREADRYRDLFEVHEGQNMYGATKRSFKLKKKYAPLISDKERQSLDHIIDVTKRLYWDDFIRLVYSTHPIASSERYEFLDLAAKAREYRAQKAVREEQAS